MKPPGPDFTGASAPVLPYGEALALVGSPPQNDDPGLTQILTQQFGAQSQTVSQLVSSGSTPTSMSPQLSPSGLTKHLRKGSVHLPHHILTTRIESWGFIKSSV
jgi:hypothetical protein